MNKVKLNWLFFIILQDMLDVFRIVNY